MKLFRWVLTQEDVSGGGGALANCFHDLIHLPGCSHNWAPPDLFAEEGFEKAQDDLSTLSVTSDESR